MKEKKKGARRERIRTRLLSNSSILLASVLISVFCWFFFKISTVSPDAPHTITGVKIAINKSDAAANEGLEVFTQTETLANIQISSVGQIGKNLTSEDFEVIGTFAPSSLKSSGTGMKTEVITLRARAKNSLSDVTIVSIDPEEITVEYDRYREATFRIDNEVTYTVESGFYSGDAILSEQEVLVTGPESAVNRVGRVAVANNISTPVKQDYQFVGGLTFYDRENKEIEDYQALHLTASVPSVEVNIEVLPKKTLKLEAAIANVPEGFANSRITVTPESIDVAGDASVLKELNTLTVGDGLDIRDVNLTDKEFTVDIILPTTVRNISNVDTAKVTVSMNGCKELQVPVTNIKTAHVPASKEVELVTKMVNVLVVGPEGQVNAITPDMISVTVDMTGKMEQLGSARVAATVSITGSNGCWVSGKYSVQVNVKEASPEPTATPVPAENLSGAVNSD